MLAIKKSTLALSLAALLACGTAVLLLSKRFGNGHCCGRRGDGEIPQKGASRERSTERTWGVRARHNRSCPFDDRLELQSLEFDEDSILYRLRCLKG